MGNLISTTILHFSCLLMLTGCLSQRRIECSLLTAVDSFGRDGVTFHLPMKVSDGDHLHKILITNYEIHDHFYPQTNFYSNFNDTLKQIIRRGRIIPGVPPSKVEHYLIDESAFKKVSSLPIEKVYAGYFFSNGNSRDYLSGKGLEETVYLLAERGEAFAYLGCWSYSQFSINIPAKK